MDANYYRKGEYKTGLFLKGVLLLCTGADKADETTPINYTIKEGSLPVTSKAVMPQNQRQSCLLFHKPALPP